MEKTINSFLKDHWAVLTSLFVFILSCIGLIYSYFYYNHFGINYLEHAELSDLIGTIFVHPHFLFSLFIFFVGLVIILTFWEIAHEAEKKEETTPKNNFRYKAITAGRKLFYIIISIFLITSPYFAIKIQVKNIKDHISPIYSVELVKGNKVIKCATSIGSTTSNLFYWDISENKAIITPKKNINLIKVILPEPPQRGYREPPAPPGQLSPFDKKLIKWEKQISILCV
jgi:hypothetical protein